MLHLPYNLNMVTNPTPARLQEVTLPEHMCFPTFAMRLDLVNVVKFSKVDKIFVIRQSIQNPKKESSMKLWMMALPLICTGIFAQAATGTLDVKVSPSAPYILPVALRSCMAEATSSSVADLRANTVEFSRFQYSWNGTGTYTMNAIVLNFSSPLLDGENYQCAIGGDELSYVLPAGGKVIYPTEVQPFDARCSLRCGGILVDSAVTSMVLNGEMKIYGTETDANGQAQPVKTVLPVSMTYEKF
jgi:hypothetical protein